MPELPLWADIVTFAIATVVIVLSGVRIARVADNLADATGMGEALTGAVFLGATTSIPDAITSSTAAARGSAEMAASNAIGGIAAQTVFLVIADVAYRRANLEHAAASLSNMLQAALLLALLGIPLVAAALPGMTILGVHPASVFMVALYVFGLRIVRRARAHPMWEAHQTSDTRADTTDANASKQSVASLWIRFGGLAAALVTSGYALAHSGMEIARESWLSESAVGALLTGVATSLAELVTSIAAVRRGAETMAVAGVIGGNAFDTLLLALADVFYREGSIYTAVVGEVQMLLSATIVMTAVLVMGLLSRQKQGPGGIGFEGVVIMGVYVLVVAAILRG